MAFFNLIGGIKGSIVLVLILALAGYIWKLNHDSTVLRTELTQVQEQRDLAASARDTAISANKTNQVLIAQLKNERDLSQSALTNLETDLAQNKINLNKIQTSIKAQSLLPENKTLLSPVLKDTINQIQLNRKDKS